MTKTAPQQTPNPRRAFIKALVVLFLVLSVAVGLSALLGMQDVDALKHSLSPTTIITLVVVINLVSFACFIVLYLAWRWIRQDFKHRNDLDL